MKPFLILACVATSCLVSACMVREERTVQPAPATAAVVAPARGAGPHSHSSGEQNSKAPELPLSKVAGRSTHREFPAVALQ